MKSPATADPQWELKCRILDAALNHVPFDGWSDATLAQAAGDCGIEASAARAAFPGGGTALALFFHAKGDADLADAMDKADLGAMRYSERVTWAVRQRLEIAEAHKDAVRRATALFALPMNIAHGSRALWQTADTIWTALGDESQDYNWYSKRVILSGVLSSTMLYWLGDTSEAQERTWAFLARRIDGVMKFEKAKSQLRENPVARMAFAGPRAVLGLIRAPGAAWTGPGPGRPGRP